MRRSPTDYVLSKDLIFDKNVLDFVVFVLSVYAAMLMIVGFYSFLFNILYVLYFGKKVTSLVIKRFPI